MRLDDLTPAHVRQAVELYMQRAWPRGEVANPWFDPTRLQGLSSIKEVLRLFTSSGDVRGGPACARYTLRLGNESYPFMKFVLQEYLVDHEYFFSVDTHDRLDIPAESPDFPEWQSLKQENQALKVKIEKAWADAGLPTNEDLKRLAEGLARVERGANRCGRLLVVDDEQGVALGLEALLEARGYTVEVAYDGRQVLERLRHDPLPDLVVLDFSMPELDGEEVLDRLRANSRTVDLPVLLATASSIDMGRMQRVSGLLRKPYPRELLFKMLDELLPPELRAGS
ncbi:MAG: response regulator [bacterium]|jgi:CheY-like chemotaxis protein|nr:response regulator [Planctomycetota bacterium]HIL52121.1 response regulator [Planctomycetota bacterium]